MGESHSAAEPEEGDTAPARAALANRPPEKPAKPEPNFQFNLAEGRGKCVAAVGKLEIKLDRAFTTIDNSRLE